MTEMVGCYIKNDRVYAHVKTVLAQAGFEYERFPTANGLLRMIGRRQFDVLLIDLGTNLAEAEFFVSWLTCRSGDHTPVIALSDAHNAEFAALALDAGADDFISGQFEALESIARIRSAIRRCNPRSNGRTISIGGYTLHRESSILTYAGERVDLTPREFTMAWLFFSSPGVYISRATIGATIWSADSDVAGRTIEQHVYKLRKKLQLGPERGAKIRTAYSQGYRLEIS